MATTVPQVDAAKGKSATWPCPQQDKWREAYDAQQKAREKK